MASKPVYNRQHETTNNIWTTGQIIEANLLNNMQNQIAQNTQGFSNIVSYSDTQPSGDYSQYNQIWLKKANSSTDSIKLAEVKDLDKVVVISQEQPTDNLNKLWIKDDDNVVQVPSFDEFSQSIEDNIAPPYLNTATYSVGQYVTYENKLYMCQTAVTTPGEWSVNSNHFIQASIAGPLEYEGPAKGGWPNINANILNRLGEENSNRVQSVNILQNKVNNIENSIAPVYSEIPYNIDDYCMHDGKLYKCKSAIVNGEEWNSTHWTQVITKDEISDLKSAIDTHEDALKMQKFDIDLQYTLESGAIGSSGTDADGNYLATSCRTDDYIDISGFDNLHVIFTRKSGAATPSGTYYLYLYFYDASKAFISPRVGDEHITSIDVAQIPENARYIRVSFTYTKLADVENSRIYGASYMPLISKVVQNTNDIDDLQQAVTPITTLPQINATLDSVKNMSAIEHTYEFTLENGAINGSGNDTTTATFRVSSCRTAGFIELGNVRGMHVEYVRADGATLPSGATEYFCYVNFYDSTQTFLERSGGANLLSVDIFTIPENAKYFRISFTYTKLEHLESSSVIGYEQAEIIKVVSELNTRVSTRGIVLGDSISFGLWSYWDGNQRKNADDIYPSIQNTAAPMRISDWLSVYYGIPMDNIARRGTGWVADTRSLGNAWDKAQATDFSGYDFVALCFGINDYIQKKPLGTITDNEIGTVIGNMIHVLEKIYMDNPLAKVVVFSPLNAWGQVRDTEGTTQVLYGDASTHFALGYNFNGTSYTLQQLIDAMESVCDRYDVRHVVMSQGFTINVFNIKDILIDGLHPSQESMKSIASDMYHTMLFR